MNSRTNIQIDDEVMKAIEKLAKPFVDKEPNDVLRRIFLVPKHEQIIEKVEDKKELNLKIPFDTVPDKSILSELYMNGWDNLSGALQQILQVVYLVTRGTDRIVAYYAVADYRGITQGSVRDKSARQLGLSTAEFDNFLKDPKMMSLKNKLLEKFGNDKEIIEEFWRKYIL